MQDVSGDNLDRKIEYQNDSSNPISVSLLGESMNLSKVNSYMNKSTTSVTKSGIPKPQRASGAAMHKQERSGPSNQCNPSRENSKRQSIGSNVSDSFNKRKKSSDASEKQLNKSSASTKQNQLPSPERNVIFGLNQSRKSQNLKDKI